MVPYSCKMCGGEILAEYDATYGKCTSCETTSTLTMSIEERIISKFNRANELFINREFDRAKKIYEEILDEDSTDPEVYWCIALCRYGVEYIEDPGSHNRLPKCHRKMKNPITTDPDYLAVFEFAQDNYTKELYRAEADRIDEIQNTATAYQASGGIEEKSGKELTIEEAGIQEGLKLLNEKKWKEAEGRFKEVLMTNSKYAPAYMGLFCANKKLMGPDHFVGFDLLESKHVKLALEYADSVYNAEIARLDRAAKEKATQQEYDKLVLKEKSTYTEAGLLELSGEFEKLGAFKNAPRYAAGCRDKAQEQNYISLLSGKASAATAQEMLHLKECFEKLGDYRDAPQQAVECAEIANELVKSQTYSTLLQRIKIARTKGDFFEIGSGLKGLGEYRDAPRLATECFDRHLELLGDERRFQRKERFRLIIRACSLILAFASVISFFVAFYANDHLRTGFERVSDSATGYMVLYTILFALFAVVYYSDRGALSIISLIIANIINLGTLFTGSRMSSQLAVGRGPTELDIIVGMTMTISCIVYFVSCVLAYASKAKKQ